MSFLSNLKTDFPSSIVVFLVAVPLCLGVAQASGAPLFSGIVAGICGGLIVGGLSGSPLSVSGPAAGLTSIVMTALGKIPFEGFVWSVVIAGVLQIVFGRLKFGVLGDFIPNSVIKGMLAAIGIILIFKEIPHLVGYDKNFVLEDDAFIQIDGHNTLSDLYYAMGALSEGSILVGAVSILILLFWETSLIKNSFLYKGLPAPLAVVVFGIISNVFFLDSHPLFDIENKNLVSLPVAGSFDEFTALFSLPNPKWLANIHVWITGFTVAIVASLESLLSIEAIDKLDPFKRCTPTNRELMAQGIGNISSGFLGGLPVTSVIVRSSANLGAGAQTKLSSMLHGFFLLCSVLFLSPILNLIPNASLAAILILTGYKLAKISLFKEFYAKGWSQFLPFVITIAAIFFTDLLKGILIGILVGLYYLIRSNFKSAIFAVNEGNNYMVRLRKDVSFLNKPMVKKTLEAIPAESNLLIDTSKADFIDPDIIETINEYLCHAHLSNIKVQLKRGKSKDAQRISCHSNTPVEIISEYEVH